MNERSLREFSFGDAVHRGFEKVAQAARVVRSSLEKAYGVNRVPVVLGGLAKPEVGWMRTKGASIVEPTAALRLLLSMNIDRYIDAIAVHIYPSIPRGATDNEQREAIAAAISDHIDSIGAVWPVKGRLWVTEWGFAGRNDCDRLVEEGRAKLLRLFLATIGNSKFQPLIAETYLFDWDENPRYAVFASPYFEQRRKLHAGVSGPADRRSEGTSKSPSQVERQRVCH